MQKKLLNSVKILSLNRYEVINRLEESIKNFAKKRSEILKVILFGSLIGKSYTPYSDADILIILDNKAEVPAKIRDRIPDYFIDNTPVPIDVFPYKEEEIQKKISENNFFIKNAIDNGKVIFSKTVE